MRSRLIFVDVEAEYGTAPSTGRMTAFGAVDFLTRTTFHGNDCELNTMYAFKQWLEGFGGAVTFVSDNPAFDWQWINYYFHLYFQKNPFGHSARRIGDFYAGLVGDFSQSNDWKKLRITPHDHHPVHDAMGNVEAFTRILKGERG